MTEKMHGAKEKKTIFYNISDIDCLRACMFGAEYLYRNGTDITGGGMVCDRRPHKQAG